MPHKQEAMLTDWVNGIVVSVIKGAEWLSGRVLESRPRGHGFERHWRHCDVFLSKTTQEEPSGHN